MLTAEERIAAMPPDERAATIAINRAVDFLTPGGRVPGCANKAQFAVHGAMHAVLKVLEGLDEKRNELRRAVGKLESELSRWGS